MGEGGRRAHPPDSPGCPPSVITARDYIKVGLIPIPLRPGTKRPKVEVGEHARDGAVDKYVQEFLEAEDKLAVFKKYCGDCCNIGIVLDKTLREGYRVMLIDIDTKDEPKIRKLAERLGEEYLTTYTVETPRGYHLLYWYKGDPLPNRHIDHPQFGHIDIIFKKTTVVPPSEIDGFTYKHLTDIDLMKEVDPKELLELLDIEIEEQDADITIRTRLASVGTIDWDKVYEIISKVYTPGHRNLIAHALVGVLYRQGASEEEILNFIKRLTELDRAQGETYAEINKRISDAKYHIRFCRENKDKCPSLKRLKEVLLDSGLLSKDEWHELLRALGFKVKPIEYVLELNPGSVRKVVSTPKGILEVRFVFEKGLGMRKSVVMKKREKTLSASSLLDVRRVRSELIDGLYVVIKGLEVGEYIVEYDRLLDFIRHEMKESSPQVIQKIKDLILKAVGGNVRRVPVSGIYFNGGPVLVSRSLLWVGDGGAHRWELPHVRPASEDVARRVLRELRKLGRYEVFVETVAWVLTALYRLYLKQHAVDVPALALVGPRASGKSYLASIMRDMFDLRVEGAKTEAQLRRAMNRSAVPFIIDEAVPDSDGRSDWLNTLKMAVANKDLLLRTIDARNQYAGKYYAFSVPLMTFNELVLTSDLLDKVAFIFVDELTRFEGDHHFDRKTLMSVGRRLIDDYGSALRSFSWSSLPSNRVGRYLALYRLAKSIVCRYVGCLGEVLHLAYDVLDLKPSSSVGEAMRSYLKHRVVITDFEKSFGKKEGLMRLGFHAFKRSSTHDYNLCGEKRVCRLPEVIKGLWGVSLHLPNQVIRIIDTVYLQELIGE